MPRVRLRALRPLEYAGRALKVGALFEAESAAHADLLRTLGLVADAPPPVTVIDDVEDDAEAPPAAAPVRRRRTYQRRDLTAEE